MIPWCSDFQNDPTVEGKTRDHRGRQVLFAGDAGLGAGITSVIEQGIRAPVQGVADDEAGNLAVRCAVAGNFGPQNASSLQRVSTMFGSVGVCPSHLKGHRFVLR